MPTASLLELLAATPAELDARFRAAGPVPDGLGRGVALLRPGTRLARPLAAWARTGWQGKTFDRDAARLRNRITPFGTLAIAPAVAEEASWVDGKPCIVLDYSPPARVQEHFSRWDEGRGLTFHIVASSVPGLRAMTEDWQLEQLDVARTRLVIDVGVEPARWLRPLGGLVERRRQHRDERRHRHPTPLPVVRVVS